MAEFDPDLKTDWATLFADCIEQRKVVREKLRVAFVELDRYYTYDMGFSTKNPYEFDEGEKIEMRPYRKSLTLEGLLLYVVLGASVLWMWYWWPQQGAFSHVLSVVSLLALLAGIPFQHWSQRRIHFARAVLALATVRSLQEHFAFLTEHRQMLMGSAFGHSHDFDGDALHGFHLQTDYPNTTVIHSATITSSPST